MPPKRKKKDKKKDKKKHVTKPVKNQQTLGFRDLAVFKQLRRFYEIKKYKNAVKAADQILKKNPNHGETLCMKGLVLNAMEREDEAKLLVKKGLMFNLKSQLCWHVHGLMYRSQHKYDDAIKCYKNALRIDPKDFKILKDLSLLQAQRRMADGFQETCRKIVCLKPSNRNNWLAYAIGNHLCKDYKQCFKILDSFHTSFTEKDYELSEVQLYYNMILEDSGDLSGALKHLDEIEKDVVDKLSLCEKRAELNLKLGNHKDAEENYRELIDYQPETHGYYHGLRQAMGLLPEKKANDDDIQPRAQRRQRSQKSQQEDLGLTDTQIQELDKLFDEIRELHPKAAAPQRLRLDYCKGDVFRERINEYLVPRLRKGVPALFRDIRNFYCDKSKVKIIEDLIFGYLENLRSDLRFTEKENKDLETPSVFNWVLYFASQHCDYLGQETKALELVDEAIAHTPTNIDLYVLKARIYKHAGNLENAFEEMNYARKLDTADRYLNTKCVRYALRANHMKKAEEIVSLFFREGDGLESLFEMQCMWYELCCGDSYLGQKQYGKALQQYLAIGKHFDTINEDQFDFHSYCLRKTTLRAYVKMLRWQDNLKSHRFFFRAAQSIIKTYVKLYDISPPVNKNVVEKEQGKRKNKKSAKEAQEKADAEEETEYEKLEKTTDPLGEATKQLKDLQLYRPNEIMTQILAADIYLRKNKALLVLKALKKAFSIGGLDHPKMHVQAMEFWKRMEVQEGTLHPVVKAMIQDERKTDAFWSGRPLEDINEEYIKTHPDSLCHCLATAKSRIILGGIEAKETAFQLINDFSLDETTTLQESVQVLEWLEKEDDGKETTSRFVATCAKRFPYATRFVQKTQVESE